MTETRLEGPEKGLRFDRKVHLYYEELSHTARALTPPLKLPLCS